MGTKDAWLVELERQNRQGHPSMCCGQCSETLASLRARLDAEHAAHLAEIHAHKETKAKLDAAEAQGARLLHDNIALTERARATESNLERAVEALADVVRALEPETMEEHEVLARAAAVLKENGA